MKILHTSDLHFGIGLHGVSLLKYQWEFCDALCEIVRGNNIDAVIVSGDIYDTSVASAEAIRCWDNLTTKLCLENGVPVIACAGNHDGAARLASYSDLLKKAGLHISGKLEDVLNLLHLPTVKSILFPITTQPMRLLCWNVRLTQGLSWLKS